MAVEIRSITSGQVQIIQTGKPTRYFQNDLYTVQAYAPGRIIVFNTKSNVAEEILSLSEITEPAGSWTEETLSAELNKFPYFYNGKAVQDVNVIASVLPTGAATLAEQQAQTTKLTSLDGKDFATATKQTSLENLLTRSSLYARRSGATSAAVKVGAGILKRVIIGDNKGTSITIYDSLSAAGTIISVINPNQEVSFEFDVPFTLGLFVVTVGVGIEVTLIYQ